jgi:hypothetical protein
MLSVNGVDNSLFVNSNSIKMLPMVSAEWNQNIFNPPYLTVAGNGTPGTIGQGGFYTEVTDSRKHPNFTTYITATSGESSVVGGWTMFADSSKQYHKVVVYLMTDSDSPISAVVSANAGYPYSNIVNEEINSFGWTKVEVYCRLNAEASNEVFFNINANKFNSNDPDANIFFTLPEIYGTTEFDYKYGSVWTTDSAFTAFRPGESYVPTGNINYSLGSANAPFSSTYRKVNTSNLMPLSYTDDFYMPVSPITANPSFFYTSQPLPVYKSALITDVSPYKYFVSDVEQECSISGLYANPIYTNKIVLKFNTYLSTPDIVVTITKSNGDTITTDTLQPDNNGMLILYLNSNSFTKNRWSTMPKITSGGDISNYISINKITVTQIDHPALRLQYAGSSNTSMLNDAARMQVIEVSPRLEVDLTDYVMNISTNKALDSKETYMPISALVTDDASVTLSAIPLGDINSPIPVFSNISNYSSSKLSGLLRKNVKFYLNYNLISYTDASNATQTLNKVIPAGVFYADTWDQSDIDVVTVQCYDITRYLQSVPATDYVASNKGAFEIITNILDLTGFTDYDIDSLYQVCNDTSASINMPYYYCSSKDTTLSDALNQIFLPYQIAAYIDNFGIMRFISLSGILKSSNKSNDISVTAGNIVQGSYKINNKAKPGKISLRYTVPRLKQSLSLQNIKDPAIKEGPSYVYTTSNDVVWEQQTLDSVGFNFLSSNFLQTDNSFSLNVTDYLDLFHTFNLNNDGYAVVENEVVSFLYKEYKISKVSNSSVSSYVYVKNDIELAAEVDRFIKEQNIGFLSNVGIISGGSHDGEKYTYSISTTPTPDVPNPLTSFKKGDGVTVSGMNPESLNCNTVVIEATSTSFTVSSSITDDFILGGTVTKASDYDIKVEPTGKITNVDRGMFGSKISDHRVIINSASNYDTYDSIGSKNIAVTYFDGALNSPAGNYDIDDINNRLLAAPLSTGKILFYPSSSVDEGYKTYSGKFNFMSSDPETAASLLSAGIFFNFDPNATSPNENAYFLELVRYSIDQKSFKYALILSQNGVTVAYANVTGVANFIVQNFQKRYEPNPNATAKDNQHKYNPYVDPYQAFNLRFTKYDYNYAEDGEGSPVSPNGQTFSVFLNNFEISGWQIFDGVNLVSTGKNTINNLSKKVVLPSNEDWTGTKFGVFFTTAPTYYSPLISSIFYNPSLESNDPPSILNAYGGEVMGYASEIYACEKTLKERNVSYYYQDREFLNGLTQGQRLFYNYKQYMVQTKPEVVGLNIYDVQYTNGPAVSVDVSPVEYSWLYFPGNEIVDQQFILHQVVDEYSLSYSTPINTGFRAKFAIVNNSPHMVYIKKDADELNNFTVTFSLWTHEAIAPSDPQIIERVIDGGNASEVVQIDAAFIQSQSSANQLLKMVGHGIENFSKDVSLSIFGNPMVEIGDVLGLTYPLAGINQQKYIVHSVSNSYDNGLITNLTLNMINKGINS